MDLLDEVKMLLRKYAIRPRRSIGQSFCIDLDLLRRLVIYSTINKDDVILEVGAGFGFLTKLLSEVAEKVIAIELDFRLVKALRDILRDKEKRSGRRPAPQWMLAQVAATPHRRWRLSPRSGERRGG